MCQWLLCRLPFQLHHQVKAELYQGRICLSQCLLGFQAKKKPYIVCKNRTTFQCIQLSDISHFETLGRLVVVHFKDRSFEFYSKLNIIEQSVKNKGFIRVHRSYIVNLSYILDADKENIFLTGHETPVPIGQIYLDHVRRETYPFFPSILPVCLSNKTRTFAPLS